MTGPLQCCGQYGFRIYTAPSMVIIECVICGMRTRARVTGPVMVTAS